MRHASSDLIRLTCTITISHRNFIFAHCSCSICLNKNFNLYLSIYLFIYIFIYISIYLFIYIYLSIYLNEDVKCFNLSGFPRCFYQTWAQCSSFTLCESWLFMAFYLRPAGGELVGGGTNTGRGGLAMEWNREGRKGEGWERGKKVRDEVGDFKILL